MKHYTLLIALAFFSAYGNSQTQLGLRALSSPQFLSYYVDLNAKAGRQIRKDHELTSAYMNQLKVELQAMKDEGIATIVALRFPNHPADVEQADRVPLLDATDLQNSLALVDSFLLKMDGVLDFVQVQNEPLGGPGKYFNSNNNLHYGYYAIQWLDTLTKHINQTIVQQSLDIQVMSAAFHDVANSLDTDLQNNPVTYIRGVGDTVYAGELTADPVDRWWHKQLMEISQPSCDVLDIHINVDNINTVKKYILDMDSLQAMINVAGPVPYSTMEWSQTKEKQTLIDTTIWMKQFLHDVHAASISVDTNSWFAFMDSLDYDTTFMQEAFCLFEEHGFIHACYAGLLQYGDSNDLGAQTFSTCALLTNKCDDITGNRPFYNLYKSITTCNVSIEEPIKELSELKVYPNPTTGMFVVQAPMNGKFDVYNTKGSLVAQGEFNQPLNMADFGKGIYFIKQQANMLKLVVQ